MDNLPERQRRLWRIRLRCLTPAFVRFAGAFIARRRLRHGGIDYIGTDFVSVTAEDNRYVIPFSALQRVTGRRGSRPNRRVPVSFRRELARSFEPQGVYMILFSRSGRRRRGHILEVGRRDVLFREFEPPHAVFRIPLSRITAAVEVLE